MKNTLSLILFSCLLVYYAHAQTSAYGVVDTADLKMSSCSFEKGANAEVLFDKAVVTYKFSTVVMLRHERIKIFNEEGKHKADIRIKYWSHNDEDISGLKAETVTLEGNVIKYTPVEAASIYTESVDKDTKALVFSFPDVKPGSVIEFKYKKTTPYGSNYPDWFFQRDIPTRYSEFDASFIRDYRFYLETPIYQPLVKDTSITTNNDDATHHIWAMKDVKAYKDEPFSDYPDDYVECVLCKSKGQFYLDWKRIGDIMLADEDFGKQLGQDIPGQQELLAAANKLASDKEKIEWLFDTVRNAMKWNKTDQWYCNDGVKRAWKKKIGNSTEINIILYNLLVAANINTFFIATRSREFGRLDKDYPSWGSFDKVVVYAQAGPSEFYVLDASNKLNTFNNTPGDLAGTTGMRISVANKTYMFMDIPFGISRVSSFINGEIAADGTLKGNMQVSDLGESKKDFLKEFNDLGEKKYIEKAEEEGKNLKISLIKLENIQNDTVPLIQTIDFSSRAAEPDGDYLYFTPNLLNSQYKDNPFQAETRVSDINFRAFTAYSFNGRYKLPPGYNIDALPKSVSMQMPDDGIVFKRVMAQQDGYLIVHYGIEYKKTTYTREAYPALRDFYKKMYDMLSEQVVLKKT